MSNISDTHDTNKKRWDSTQKKELMKLYSKGKSYQEMGNVLNRSPNAIKLRVESIIYDNLVRGKSVHTLSRMLNIDSDMVKQLYYSHKSFKQSRGEPTTDVDFAIETNNTNLVPQSSQRHYYNQHQQIAAGKRTIRSNNSTVNDKNNSHKRSKNNDILERLEGENRILDEIIKNYRMKKHLRKLYVDGKLDKRSLNAFEKIVKP
jgi:hypothetical protein